jgi:hypothetical protein
VAKLVWRVKLVTELLAGETTEVEVACIERDEQVDLSDLGLRLAEAKQLTSGFCQSSRQSCRNEQYTDKSGARGGHFLL